MAETYTLQKVVATPRVNAYLADTTAIQKAKKMSNLDGGDWTSTPRHTGGVRTRKSKKK
jgi:hypothetical protein